MSIVPLWVKLFAVGALLAITNGITFMETSAHYKAKIEANEIAAKKAVKDQENLNDVEMEEQKRIVKGVVDGWDQTVRDLRDRYADVRVCKPATKAGRSVPSNAGHSTGVGQGSASGKTTDAPKPNEQQDEVIEQPEEVDVALAADCAVTAEMFRRLRRWYKETQASVNLLRSVQNHSP